MKFPLSVIWIELFASISLIVEIRNENHSFDKNLETNKMCSHKELDIKCVVVEDYNEQIPSNPTDT